GREAGPACACRPCIRLYVRMTTADRPHGLTLGVSGRSVTCPVNGGYVGYCRDHHRSPDRPPARSPMTVVLLVLCMVVGALELWVGKQSRDQARAFERRVEELREQVGKQSGVLVTVGERLTAELSRVKREVLPALEERLRSVTRRLEELGELVRHADDCLKAQEARLHRLEQQRIA